MGSEGGKEIKGLSFVENFALSGAAAVISKTAAAPIERVKLMVQNQDEMLKAGSLDKPYKGVIDCTMRTFKNEGLLPFWRGNLANCLRYFPTQALNFAFKDKIKAMSMFQHKKNEFYIMNLGKNVASGGLAGASSLLFVYSLDYARTRLANDAKRSGPNSNRQFDGLIDVYKKTLKSDGIVGLYRGFVISCVGIMVYRGCYFGFYDTLKPLVLGEDAGVTLSFLLGYAVTITSGLISYPIDTVRRRMMMTSGASSKYKGSWDCASQVIAKEGYMSLMKGAGANIIRSVAGAGVLALFDKFKDMYAAMRLGSKPGHGNQDMKHMSHNPEVPGHKMEMSSMALGGGAALTQSFKPLKGIHQHVCGLHYYDGDLKRQVMAHHFCSHLNEEMRQCVIYESGEANARLIGIEYIISERLFNTLPDDEKKYWHSHVYEVKSGMLSLPSIPEMVERQDMEKLVHTYGKTYHLWQVDRGDPLPLGPASLMMAFTADGQADPKLLAELDRRVGGKMEDRRKARAKLPTPKISPLADQGLKGKQ